ncbi:Ig-like domain-containing protein [Geotalea uraniireducens]|uniref:Ig-like domain-containing protein n=1 Tax=Geotalea uraniireducens TaxID=351604 RepID=UPI002492971B|nr:Ig-like domain-containing protein [Geotalea uraniireducens]
MKRRSIFWGVARVNAVILCVIGIFAYSCYGAVVFEDNFDSQTDWNVNGQYEGSECSVSSCTSSSYPANWNFYRTVPGSTGLNPVASIRRLPGNLADHTSGSGKAYIVYNESVSGVNWPGDGIIGKYFGSTANYNELYIRFWLRTQSGWQSATSAQSKIFRVTHWRGTSNIFQWAAESSPTYFWDFGTSSSASASYLPAYRCDQSPTDYYCVNLASSNNYQKNDYLYVWGSGGPTSKFADTQWHRYDYHIKMNDPGQNNGILEWSFDGNIVESHNDVVWKEASSTSSLGWNAFALGGNSNNTFSSTPTDQWYAVDDLVVSTTAIPDSYTIGGTSTTTDTTAPTVAITSPANSSTVSGTATVTASASDNVGVSKVEFYVNGTLNATDTASPYTFSWNTSSLANGTYTLSAKAYDAANNVGQSSSVTVTVSNGVVDTTSPSVALSSPSNNTTISGTVAVAANASDNVSVSKVEFYENNVLIAAANAAPYSFNWNSTSVANGSCALTAKAYDAAGNVGQSSAVTVTVSNPVADTTAPTVTMTSPTNGSTVSGTVTISASASDNVGVTKVEFYVNNALDYTATAAPYSYTADSRNVADGTYTFYAKAYDAAGNVGQSAVLSATVNNTSTADTTAPTVSISSPAAAATVKGTVTVSATASDNVKVSKVEFYVNNVLKRTDTYAPYSYSWDTTTGADGSYTLLAKAYDAAGNVGQSSAVKVTVKNDTTAPTVSISSPATGTTVTGVTTVTATASDNVSVSKVEFYVNGTLKATDTASPYTFSWDTTSLTNGSYSLTAKAYDASGNVGQSSTVTATVNNPVADTTAPTVAISSPTSGSTVSGTATVSVAASDNVGVSKVEFYVNNVLQATDTAAPYTFTWNTAALANGSYTLSAKAYDAAGNVGQSSSQTVTVSNVVIMKGDVDGDGAITVKDVLAVLKAVSDPTLLTTAIQTYGDVAPLDTVTGKPVGDGKIDVNDALLLLQYVVGMVTW